MTIMKKRDTDERKSAKISRSKAQYLKKRSLAGKTHFVATIKSVDQLHHPSSAVKAEVIEVTKSGIIVAVGDNQVTYSFRVNKVRNYSGEPLIDAGIKAGASVRILKRNGEILRASILK
jgi:hypothetical protein